MLNDILRYHVQPLVLLAAKGAWLTEQLSGALMSAGYRVVIAHDEHDTLDKAQTHRPHGIVLAVDLAPPGYELCRALRSVCLGAPIVLVSPEQPTRDQCLAAVHGGAWELRGAPLDTEEFIARLGAYIEPRLELDRVSEERLVDRVTGLYNSLGLDRRAKELAALAARHGLALACMVFRPADEPPRPDITDQLALSFKSVGRSSDAVGRTGRAEFTVYAPARNNWAAGRLVHRLTDRASGYVHGIDVRSGYSAASPGHKISSHELLAQARSVLEASRAG